MPRGYPARDVGNAALAAASNDVRNAALHLTEWTQDPEHLIRHLTAALRHVELAIAAMGDGTPQTRTSAT